MHKNIKNGRFSAKICIFGHFSLKFYWPQIDPKNKSFRDLDANNQMSHSCGHNETLNSSWNPYFSCVMDIYFSPFFFDHPVGGSGDSLPFYL